MVGSNHDTLISILKPYFYPILFPSFSLLVTYPFYSFFCCSSISNSYPSSPCCLFGHTMPLSSYTRTANCESCGEHGLVGHFLEEGPPVRLVWVVSIRVSFLWGAISPLSHSGVGTHELGFGGVFVVCLYSSVRLDLGYLVSQFRIGQGSEPVYLKRTKERLFFYNSCLSVEKPSKHRSFTRCKSQNFLLLQLKQLSLLKFNNVVTQKM